MFLTFSPAASGLPPRGQQGRPNESPAFRQRVRLWVPGPAGARVGGKIIIQPGLFHIKTWERIEGKNVFIDMNFYFGLAKKKTPFQYKMVWAAIIFLHA